MEAFDKNSEELIGELKDIKRPDDILILRHTPNNTPAEDSTVISRIDEPVNSDNKPTPKKKKNRCGICNKKLGLMPITCRCGGNFCGAHRYTTEHDCDFDFKSNDREVLSKNNPKIVSEKLNKI